jgi:hypothetical protein
MHGAITFRSENLKLDAERIVPHQEALARERGTATDTRTPGDLSP